MKFLLCAVNAKYIHSNPAVYSLCAYAGEPLKSYVEIAEYTINQHMEEILADIYERQPDAIGLSCYIWNFSLIQELMEEIPKVLPKADIWLGGPEVSFDAPKVLLQYPQVTGIMVGEGEDTFRELLEYYVNHSGPVNVTDIPGLCTSGGFTAPRRLTDMNRLPFLYEHPEQFANRIIYYESSRGCPYRCSYCLSSIDKKVRFRDLGMVKKELQCFLDHQVAQVKFVDRTFNCNHEHAMTIWTYLFEQDNGVTNFHFEIAGDLLRDEELTLLAKMRPGLIQLEIGVQSYNPQTLAAIHRTTDPLKLERNIAAIRHGHNIHIHLDLIAGLPFEDYESFGRSFDRVYAMGPEQLQIGFLKVLKGSEMYDRVKEFGICSQSRAPYEVLYTNWLSYEEVRKLKRVEEMVELYYNSNQYAHTLVFLENAFSSPFAMYEALADFYEQKGYVQNSPARGYRYQVLLDFAVEAEPQYGEIYRELLTFDFYLRENAKSRPDFAMDIIPWKEEMKAFYRWEEAHRQYLPAYEGYDSRQLSKMTHLEPFTYPVWDDKKMAQIRWSKEQPVTTGMVLFDYQNRDPLTYEAAVQIVKGSTT